MHINCNFKVGSIECPYETVSVIVKSHIDVHVLKRELEKHWDELWEAENYKDYEDIVADVLNAMHCNWQMADNSSVAGHVNLMEVWIEPYSDGEHDVLEAHHPLDDEDDEGDDDDAFLREIMGEEWYKSYSGEDD